MEIIDKYKKLIKELIQTLPYNINESILPSESITFNINSKYYKQAILNNLISFYHKKLPYNLLKRKFDLPNVSIYSNSDILNLILNIRLKNYENISRYCFGYIPLNINRSNYYYFSNISPCEKDPKEHDFIFIHHSQYENKIPYEDFLKLSQIKEIKYKKILYLLPIISSRFDTIKIYLKDPKLLKDTLLQQVNKYPNLGELENLILSLNVNLSPQDSYFIETDSTHYFEALIAHYIDLDLSLNNNRLNTISLGYMIYRLFQNRNLLQALSSHLPKIVPYENNTIFSNSITHPPQYIVAEKKMLYATPHLKRVINPGNNLLEIVFSFASQILENNYNVANSIKNLVGKIGKLNLTLKQYNFKDLEIVVPIAKYKIDNKEEFYKFYEDIFIILKNLILVSYNKNSIFDIKLIIQHISCIIVVLIQNYQTETLNNKNIPEYNKLINYINDDVIFEGKRDKFVTLYAATLNCINAFLTILNYSGGVKKPYQIFDPIQMNSFDFLSFVYILDVTREFKEGNEIEKHFCDYERSNAFNKFWDGIAYHSYNSLNDNDKYILITLADTIFLENAPYHGTKASLQKSSQNIIRVCFYLKMINNQTHIKDIYTALKQKLRNDFEHSQDPYTFSDKVARDLKNINYPSFMNQLNKYNDPADALGLLNYFKYHLKKGNNEDVLNSFYQILLFMIAFLSKIGFDVQTKSTPNHVYLSIRPLLTEENIKKFIQKNSQKVDNEQLDTLIDRSKNILDIMYKAGSPKDEEETIIQFNNLNIDPLGNINEKIFNEDLNLYNILNEKFNIFEEDKYFNEKLNRLLLNENVTTDDIYDIIPNYIKNQVNYNDKGGAMHPVDILLAKLNSSEQSKPDITDKIEGIIKDYLTNQNTYGNYISNLNSGSFKYDLNRSLKQNSILENKDYLNLLIEMGINNLTILKDNKIIFDDKIKEDFLTCIKSKYILEEQIYRYLIVFQNIKNIIMTLYKRLKIQPEEYHLSETQFHEFFKSLKEKIKEKQERDAKYIYELVNNFRTKMNLKLPMGEQTNFIKAVVEHDGKCPEILIQNTQNIDENEDFFTFLKSHKDIEKPSTSKERGTPIDNLSRN